MSAQEAGHVLDVTDVEENIRKNVKTFMAHRGLAGTQVAPHLGLNKATFSNRLTGTTKFTAAELYLLAQVLGTTVEVLASDPDSVLRSRCDAPPRHLTVVHGEKHARQPALPGLGNRAVRLIKT